MALTTPRIFESFDRTERATGELAEPDRYRELRAAMDFDRPLIPRGSGLSYVSASFGDAVRSIGMRHFNRILDFDPDTGLVEVEAGISLGKLFAFLAPRGSYLPVQPGHPQITVGGCVAGNIHGKNQFREGLFCDWVESVVIWHPDRGELRLSRTEEPDLFALTCGGFGLSGLIVSARLKTVPLPSMTARMSAHPFQTVAEGVASLQMQASEASLIYGWIDLTSQRKWGSGLVIQGDVVPNGHEVGAIRQRTHWTSLGGRSVTPLRFNRMTAPWISRVYRFRALFHSGRTMDLFRFLYPTVGLERYYDLYGKDGFWEQQTLIPAAVFGDYMKDFRAIHTRRGETIMLATLKLFGGRSNLLNFGGEGISLAIDVRASDSALGFFRELDALNCAFGARTNILKDSRLSAETVSRQYGSGYTTFNGALAAFDPKRRFRSALSMRLGL